MLFSLEAYGFTSFQKAHPDLHTDVIVGVWSTTTGDRFGSLRSIDFMRAWYTTWIKGPETLGCGMHAEAVLKLFPGADRSWTHEIVLLHDACMQIVGQETPGVLSESYFDTEHAFWVESGKLWENTPMCDILGLSRGNCKTKLKHQGVFYPRRQE